MSARGSSGGLATLWSKDLFSLENSFVSQHWIFTELRHFSSKITLSLFNLYVPVTFQEKRDCLNSLDVFLAARNLSNIIIVGDLNITLAPKEKKRWKLWERSYAQNSGANHLILGFDRF